MSLFSSSHFASNAATGKDWAEVTQQVLDNLRQIRAESPDFNIGFVYISDLLVNDASSILNLLQTGLDIKHWVGTVGVGVCGNGESFIDTPAISVMIGHIEPEHFHVFDEVPGLSLEHKAPDSGLANWLSKNTPMLSVVHGDPLAPQDPAKTLEILGTIINGFVVGGLSSSRTEHIHIADTLKTGDISGIVLSEHVRVATTLSQGCKPIGAPHIITRGNDHIVRELDSKRVSEVFEDDLRAMAIRKIDRDPDTIIIDKSLLDEDNPLPEEFRSIFKGEIHVAFPISQSDQSDYLVRNIIGIDPDESAMIVSETVTTGDSVLFVHRDEQTVVDDLRQQLTQLRNRVTADTGTFAPKGAIYISCAARGFSEAGGETGEMQIVREIIGDIPLAGFYAGGEINNARLYGYTGILTLFL